MAPRERARLRVLRVAQALLLFAVAPLTLVVAIVALSYLGGDPSSASRFVRVVLFTAIGVTALGVIAGLPEYARLYTTRHKRANRPQRTNERELAPAWYAAFERARDEQGFGPGRAVSRAGTAIGIVAVAVVLAFCVLTIMSASVITGVGQVLTGLFSRSEASYLVNQAQQLRGGTSYRTPPADSVSPVEAGEALLVVASTTGGPRKSSPLERRIVSDYPRWSRVVPPADMFPKPPEMMWTTAAIRAAGIGLAPAQLELLRRASAHPARAEFSRAATARGADVYGALLHLPVRAPIHLGSFPLPNLFGLRAAAESHAALVALDVAEKRPLDAERHAREIISVGSEVLDLPVVIQSADGFDVLTRGVSALESVYIATGREGEARALADSVIAAAAKGRVFVGAGTDGLRRAAHNSQLIRGMRMEMITPLVVQACADPGQLLFGVNDSYRETVRYARDSLARFPGERAYVDALDDLVARGVLPDEPSPGVLPMIARFVDWVVGGNRFESCASLGDAFRQQ